MKKLFIFLFVLLLSTNVYAVDFTQRDKQWHVGMHAAATAITYVAVTKMYPNMPAWKQRTIAVVIPALLGVFKEYAMDSYGSGEDLVANATGHAIGLALTWKF